MSHFERYFRGVTKWKQNNIVFQDQKEVKVLVDLAMISAEGQGDMEVQKVKCLHATATGYGPLIYELKQEMGFREFLPLCQAVWRVLEIDKDLPDKFVSDIGIFYIFNF